MSAYLIYNQLISSNIMMEQDIPNPPLMLPISNAHTSMMIQGIDNHLGQFINVHPTKLVLILLNKVIILSIWLIVTTQYMACCQSTSFMGNGPYSADVSTAW